jgi:hypothetical protein
LAQLPLPGPQGVRSRDNGGDLYDDIANSEVQGAE